MLFVTCNLKGGLGNQLFQIFATLSYGFEHQTQIYFTKAINAPSVFTPRYVYWDSFLKKLDCICSDFIQPKIQNIFVVAEKDFSYHKLPFPTEIISNKDEKHVILLNGYFQSYKYFEKYKDKIMHIINFEDQQFQCLTKFPSFATNSYVSLHFRLGDYKHLTHLHPILDLNYYITALRLIESSTTKHAVCFFEEEDETVIDNYISRLQKEFEFDDWTFAKRPKDIADWEEFLLISTCKINIIANSTFSLFAAYLNTHIDKKIYYPSKWFAGKNASFQINDLFPTTSNWIRVPG